MTESSHQQEAWNSVSVAAKIAIVDDDEGIREALQGLLASIGHEALLFASAQEFLAFQNREELNCLILDMRMPGMTGLELQAVLRQQTNCPPIIFMTSYADERTKKAALNGGAHCFLGKPVNDQTLIDCIDQILAEV